MKKFLCLLHFSSCSSISTLGQDKKSEQKIKIIVDNGPEKV